VRNLLVPKIIFYTAALIIGIRFVVLLFFALFGRSEIGTRLLEDSFHHYFFGLLIVPLSLILRKQLKSYFYLVFSLGLALFLEEYSIWLADLGITTPNPYLSAAENLVTFTVNLALLAGSFYLFTWR
jgi:hypothetical protein